MHRANHHWLLILIHPPGHRVFGANLRRSNGARLAAFFWQVPFELIPRFVELHHTDAIKLDDLAEFVREHTEQLLGVAMRTDGLRDAQERLVTFCAERVPCLRL